MGDDLLKISQVAELSGTSVSTVKHYIAEGLISPVKKTGRTMAWYDRSAVDRVKAVKILQQERFLPLSVIRRLLGEEAAGEVQVELARAIFRIPQSGLERRTMSLGQLAGETDYPVQKIQLLAEAGILCPEEDRFSELDAKIVEITRDREAQGLDFEYNVRLLRAYARGLDEAVEEDVRQFTLRILEHVTAEEALPLISGVDESLNLFLFYARQQRTRRVTEIALHEFNHLTDRIRSILPFPLRGERLPQTAPSDGGPRFVWRLARGKYREAARDARSLPLSPASRAAVRRFLYCLSQSPGGTHTEADERSDHEDSDALAGVCETAATLCRLSREAGIVEPIREFIRNLTELQRISRSAVASDLATACARLIIGVVYLAVPTVLGLADTGRRTVDGALGAFRLGIDEALPLQAAGEPAGAEKSGHRLGSQDGDWLRWTIEQELVPALGALATE